MGGWIDRWIDERTDGWMELQTKKPCYSRLNAVDYIVDTICFADDRT